MKRFLLFLSLLFSTTLFAQQPAPVTFNNGTLTLKGKGAIGLIKDKYQYYQFNNYLTGNVYLQAYFKSLTNKASSYTGLAFRNLENHLTSDGGVAILGVIIQNDTLKIIRKTAYNQRTQTVYTNGSIKTPVRLRIEVSSNDFKVYYSNEIESKTNPNFIQLLSINNAFLGWSNISQNFITGSNTNTLQTAIVTKRSYGTLGSVAPSAPMLASNPTSPIAGNLVTLSVTGCSGTVGFFRNNVSIFGSSPLTINSPVANDYYTAKCTIGSLISASSNIVSISSANSDGGATGITAFINNTKLAPFETVLSKYSPDKFPTISIINSIDPVLGKLFPNWSISWKVEGLNFSNSTINKKTPNVGIPFMFDMLPVPYGGTGQRCIDYVYPQDPNTGQVWLSDNACADAQFNPYYNNLPHTNANFSSALPFEQRAGDGGGAGLDRIAEWNGISDLGYFFDQGTIGAERFGLRDWVNGKANVGLSDYDNEATFAPDKSLAILLGLANKSQGYVFDQYANILQGVYIDPSQYPLDFNNPNSTYPAWTQLVDERDGEPNSGNAGRCTDCGNNVPTRAFWNPSYKISIPSRFSGTRGVVDAPNILPSTEISCIASATFRQGDSYVYNTTGGTRIVNKFGLNANTQHMIARTIFSGETHKWYCVNRLSNRKMILQAKILCDQQQNGLLLNTDYTNTYITNTALANKHFDREYSFDIGAFVAFTGCEWNVWDRNQQGVNLDGYNGAFGIINLLNQKKTFGTESVSFVDLKPRAKFLLWTSEISYNGGTTYLQEKSHKYVMSSTSIPQRQFVTPDGYWGGYLARPENTEAVSCILRLVQNGQTYTHTVTPSMWQTVDYDYRNTPLASLPNAQKDYYYFLIKLGSQVVDNTAITAPVISVNPVNPTEGVPTTFTSSACNTGIIKWYNGDAEVSRGLTYSPAYTIANNIYKATCTIGTQTSLASNSITIGAFSSAVNITYPSGYTATSFSGGQNVSYWNNRANRPSIFQNVAQFNESTDIVKMKNDKIEVWIDLKAGGQICYASDLSLPKNLVYIGYDRGFEWQADYTQYLVGGHIEGQTSGSPQNNTDYNTTQGGDYNNHGVHLVDYYATADGFYTETRPILYPFNSVLSQTTIKTTYKLVGNMLKINYKYTSFRTDDYIEVGNPVRYKGMVLPVMFILEEYKKYASYNGGNPWGGEPLSEGDIPNATGGTVSAIGANSTERWGMVFNPDNNHAIGVFNKSNGGTTSNITWEQLNKGQFSSQGTNTTGPYTVMSMSQSVAVPDGHNYVHDSEAWITFGNKDEIRSRFQAIRNN